MGTSAAPMIANLTLFMAELKYVKMVAGNIRHVGDGQWQLLRQLSFCNRYIDDLLNLCVDRTTFNGITLEIYSAIGLEITDETGDNPRRLDYLDMTIWYSRQQKRMVSKLYDKRTLLQKKGLVINKFPHATSCLSKECKYGVVTSQCARFMTACSEPKHFLAAAVELRATCVNKNYDVKLVDKHLEKFLCKHRQQLRFHPNAVKLKHEYEIQHKERFNASIKNRYTITEHATNNNSIQPIIGRRCMGNKTNYFLVQTDQDTQTWQQQPMAIQHTTGGLNYLVQGQNNSQEWASFDRVPRLPCPGMVQPNRTITEADRQRICINKARAIQQAQNKEIARSRVAMQLDQEQMGAAWPAPIMPTQETPQAKRKRAEAIQDEYSEWLLATAPRKRLAPTPTADSALQSRMRDTLLPTDPMELEDALLGGSRGFVTHSFNPSSHFMGLNLNWRD